MLPRCQILQLKESIVVDRLALPGIDILTDKRITDQFKHLTDRQRDVVPGLLIYYSGKRVIADVIIYDTITAVFCLFLIMMSADIVGKLTIVYKILLRFFFSFRFCFFYDFAYFRFCIHFFVLGA